MNNQFIPKLDKDIEDIHAESILKSRQQNTYVVIGSIKSSRGEDRGFIKCRWCYATKEWEIVLVGYIEILGNKEPLEIKTSYLAKKLVIALNQLNTKLIDYIEKYNKEIHLINA